MKCNFLIFWTLLFISQFSYSQSQHVTTIRFAENSYSIDSEYKPILKELSLKLKSDSCSMIKIFGFADSSGSEDYNDLISEKRVNVVYNYLISLARFDTSKVYATWMGESDEAYDLHFPEAHIQQRCVDIWVQYNPKSSAIKKNK